MIDYDDIEYINGKMSRLYVVWGLGIGAILLLSMTGFFLFDSFVRSMEFTISESQEHSYLLYLIGCLTIIIAVQFATRIVSLKVKLTEQGAKTAYLKYLFLVSVSSAIALVITLISLLTLLFTKNFIYFSVINLIAVELMVYNYPKKRDVMQFTAVLKSKFDESRKTIY